MIKISKENKQKILLYVILLIGLVFMFLLDFKIINIAFTDDLKINNIYSNAISRTIGILLVIFLLRYLKIKIIDKDNMKVKIGVIIFIIPAIIVAINNYPWLSLIDNTAYYNDNYFYLISYIIIECLIVGIFEELVFRVLIYKVFTLFFKERYKNNQNKQIIYSLLFSSLVFSLAHAFSSLSFGSVLMQVGYTFLLGLMLNFIIYKTNNIFYCILIHTIYNIGGYAIGTFVTRTSVSLLLIIGTLCISILVLIYYLFVLIKDLKKRNEIT